MTLYAGYIEIHVEKKDTILVITLDKPAKRNSINRRGYVELGRVFRDVATDDDVRTVVLTGKGDFFTSGNDLSVDLSELSDIEKYVKESNDIFKEMVGAFIDCPKLIVALINGPCVGVGVTLIPLCDIAWCSTTAYFYTPFTKLGIVPEACSSYTFPLILGRSKANEMLLLSQKITAQEAYQFGFVSKLYDATALDTEIWPSIREISELPLNSLRISKSLVRMHDRDALYRVLHAESEELKKRFLSDEFANAMMAFATRKNNSKL
ncbi:enoyl-CoA delta isomerase 2 [Eurosta solidaginis]|uniref:enoyl-CoA delta isomerase 2 n=1 Tax=Eurosta solidaginis TaxID=178769 RepID=UPI00353078C2